MIPPAATWSSTVGLCCERGCRHDPWCCIGQCNLCCNDLKTLDIPHLVGVQKGLSTPKFGYETIQQATQLELAPEHLDVQCQKMLLPSLPASSGETRRFKPGMNEHRSQSHSQKYPKTLLTTAGLIFPIIYSTQSKVKLDTIYHPSGGGPPLACFLLLLFDRPWLKTTLVEREDFSAKGARYLRDTYSLYGEGKSGPIFSLAFHLCVQSV